MSVLVVIALSAVSASTVRLVRASPLWSMNLDANSTSQTDVTISSSSTQNKSFRVGVIVNASSAFPLSNVWAWSFEIDYNGSAFVPQGAPGPSSAYPDQAQSAILLGSQTRAGTVNWAGYQSDGKAGVLWGFYPGRVMVSYTLFRPTPPVTISAKTLLASVDFELLSKPGTPQSFNINTEGPGPHGNSFIMSDDGFLAYLAGVVAGAPISEKVTNDPPLAKFTVTSAPNIGPFAYTFNATTSSDRDDSIPNPAGYFWDFGDGTQDLGMTGPVVSHDYGTNGTFTATLRVQDSLGATGAARDASGGPTHDFQPSHARRTVPFEKGVPPFAYLWAPLGACGWWCAFASEQVHFSGDFRSPDQTASPIHGGIAWFWDFGDGTKISFTGPYQSHAYTRPGAYNVVLTVLNDDNLTTTTQAIVTVHSAFTFTPSTPTVGENVSFDGTLIPANSRGLINWDPSWFWNFGDNSTGSGLHVSHIYNNPGDYTVILQAYGCPMYDKCYSGINWQFNMEIEVHQKPSGLSATSPPVAPKSTILPGPSTNNTSSPAALKSLPAIVTPPSRKTSYNQPLNSISLVLAITLLMRAVNEADASHPFKSKGMLQYTGSPIQKFLRRVQRVLHL